MLKKYSLKWFFSGIFIYLLYSNLFCAPCQQEFCLDEKCKLQLTQSVNAIHDYYNNFEKLGPEELYRYEFDEPTIIKKNIEEIYICLLNFLCKDLLISNDFIKKYKWLIKNNDPLIREAAAYYYCANILVWQKDNLDWQKELIDEYLSLLQDNYLNVQRAAIFSLSEIVLKTNLDEALRNKIFSKININYAETKDPFVLGNTILCFIQYKNFISWRTVKKHYKNSHRFVRLCVIKALRASVNDDVAASWAYGLAYKLNLKNESLEKLNDFHALCSIVCFVEKYARWTYTLVWNSIHDENTNNKLTGLETMLDLYKGSSIKIGNKIYIDPFLPKKITLKDKREIYQTIIVYFKSDNPKLREAALNLCVEFVAHVNDQFDFEVIQDLAIHGFNDPCIDVKVAATKIFEQFVYKDFDLKKTKMIAADSLQEKNNNLKAAALGIYKALVSKNQFLQDSLTVFRSELNNLSALAGQHSNDTNLNLNKNIFNLGKALIFYDYKIEELITTVKQIKSITPTARLDFLDLCKTLSQYKNFADEAFDLSKAFILNKPYSNFTNISLEIIDNLINSEYKIEEIKKLAAEMINSDSDCLKKIIGFKIYNKLIIKNYNLTEEIKKLCNILDYYA